MIAAPSVDGSKDRRMAGGDRGSAAKVLAANGDEIGVGGERSSECRTVNGVPGGLQLADNVLERGSLGWREIGRQLVSPQSSVISGAAS